jgi:hypothetical protein
MIRAGRPPVSVSRRFAIFAIKSLHTAIFAVVSSSIVYVFIAGLTGRYRRRAGVASAVVLVEIMVFAGNRFRCPLRQVAEDLGAESGQVTDIFLPGWFADRIPFIYTPPFAIGVALLLWRRRREGG